MTRVITQPKARAPFIQRRSTGRRIVGTTPPNSIRTPPSEAKTGQIGLCFQSSTAVRIKNRAKSMLALERMQVPVTHLALYRASEGRLWTQDVVFERESDDDFVALRLGGRGKPAAAGSGEVKQIAGPRIQPSGSIVMRAFTSLFK